MSGRGPALSPMEVAARGSIGGSVGWQAGWYQQDHKHHQDDLQAGAVAITGQAVPPRAHGRHSADGRRTATLVTLRRPLQ